MPSSVFVSSQHIATIAAMNFLCKNAKLADNKGLCTKSDQCLHTIPEISINDRLMPAFNDDSLVLWPRLAHFGLEADTAVLPLHHISDVHFVGQNISNRGIFPEPAINVM